MVVLSQSNSDERFVGTTARIRQVPMLFVFIETKEPSITLQEEVACTGGGGAIVQYKTNTVIREPLVDWERILLPALNIKIALQLIEALNKFGNCLAYLCQAFPGLTIWKLKAEISEIP